MEPPQINIPPTRSYQQEMLDASLIQNVVIVLDTGMEVLLYRLSLFVDCYKLPREWENTYCNLENENRMRSPGKEGSQS